MKLQDIKRIRIVYDESEVNKAIQEGFVIQRILQSRTNGDENEIRPCFIMGHSKL